MPRSPRRRSVSSESSRSGFNPGSPALPNAVDLHEVFHWYPNVNTREMLWALDLAYDMRHGYPGVSRDEIMWALRITRHLNRALDEEDMRFMDMLHWFMFKHMNYRLLSSVLSAYNAFYRP